MSSEVHVLVAESQSSVLSSVADALDSLDCQVVRCYSRPRLELALNRSPKGAIIVCRGRAPFGMDLKDAVAVVPFDPVVAKGTDSGALNCLVAAVKQRLSNPRRQSRHAFKTVVIASSTGGFPEVLKILDDVRLEQTTVVVCQHIGAAQSEHLADRLRAYYSGEVVLVTERTVLMAGRVHLLAGGSDWEFETRPRGTFLNPVDLDGTPYHPSATRLFQSVSPSLASRSCFLVLSGLGNDGSAPLGELRAIGAHIVAQEPSEAIADGMPRAAIASGAVCAVLTTSQLAREFTERMD